MQIKLFGKLSPDSKDLCLVFFSDKGYISCPLENIFTP